MEKSYSFATYGAWCRINMDSPVYKSFRNLAKWDSNWAISENKESGDEMEFLKLVG